MTPCQVYANIIYIWKELHYYLFQLVRVSRYESQCCLGAFCSGGHFYMQIGTSPPDKMAAARVVLSLVLLAVVFSAGLGVVYLQAVQLSSHLQGK